VEVNIILAIIVTSAATYLSRFLGVVTSEKIKETSKIFRWFNCLAYSTLAALIARVIIFPEGNLLEIDYSIRFIVVFVSLLIFYLTKKNLVYPTVFSVILLSILSSLD
jgi:branched-subunit amino acid transport protein|tara:strand:+ start:436 stop:759 length:324 start_codon:yes stop_codon:yes gene_type:complete